MSKIMSRTFYRMRPNLPSRGATVSVVPRRGWHMLTAICGSRVLGAPGDYTGLTTYSVISW